VIVQWISSAARARAPATNTSRSEFQAARRAVSGSRADRGLQGLIGVTVPKKSSGSPSPLIDHQHAARPDALTLAGRPDSRVRAALSDARGQHSIPDQFPLFPAPSLYVPDTVPP